MSKLSEYCKQCMETNGYTVYSLAKSSGLDRTSIHRLVSGKRTPTKEFLTHFCHSLRINHYEEKNIFELFEEEKVGTSVYNNRKHIRKLFQKIQILDMHSENSLKISSFSLEGFARFTDTLSTTKAQIFHLVDMLMNLPADEEPYLLCNLPMAEDISFHEIIHLLAQRSQRNIRFEQLITLMASPSEYEDHNYNLTTFSYILPLALSDFHTYIPHYTYSHMEINDSFQLQWPYYLISNHFVLEISSDMKKSILHLAPDQVRFYRKELEHIFSDARTFLQIPSSQQDALRMYQQFSVTSNSVLGIIEPLPCFANCVPKELVRKALLQIQPSKETLQNLNLVISSALTAPPAPCYFSASCLIQFMKTGQFIGQLYAFLPPLSVAERRMVLQNFLKHNTGKGITSYLLKSELSINKNLYIELYHEQKLLFCIFNEQPNVRFALLSESSIYDAFADFFQYLSEPVNSYSLEETNQIVCQLMKEHLPE